MSWKKMMILVNAMMMTICFANEHDLSLEKKLVSSEKISIEEADKVYVNLNQLLIDKNGMFLFAYETPVQVDALFRDQKGFYVLRNQLEIGYNLEECPNGHPSRHADGRCNQRSCPYFRG